MNFLMIWKREKATKAPSSGEIIQPEEITMILDQFTDETPAPINPKPNSDPTIAWVVETGNPKKVAMC